MAESKAAQKSSLILKTRKSKDRGHAEHGWLNSYHTFSFASYSDERFDSFHSLRVINEDRVTGGEGFGTHSHREFEIFSYVVSGALLHQDSMGNREVIKRGDVQFTSAGKGLSHSEYNASKKELVHFIQMWVKPSKRELEPSYATRHYDDKQKEGKLCLIVGPEAKDAIHINQDIKVYASILKPKQEVTFELSPGRDAYVHLIQDITGYKSEASKTGLTVSHGDQNVKLASGDGLFVRNPHKEGTARIIFTGAGQDDSIAEFILFDVVKEAVKEEGR